jgi:mannan endo-1,4-beta-mannosidase
VTSSNLQWSLQPVDGTYKLISQNSGLSLETPGQHDANGQQINQWSYYGGGNQQWKLTDTGNGIYKIIGVESGRSLDINTNGTVVQIYDYATNKNSQQFQFTSTEVGQFRITPNCAPGSCLDVYGASTANGGIVNLWQWNGGDNQKWSFQKP